MKIGIDLGGHTLIAALVSDGTAGSPPAIERIITENTPEGRSVGAIMGVIADEVGRLSAGRRVSMVGVAIPGMLDKDRVHSRRLPNFPLEWDDLDVPAALAAALAAKNADNKDIEIKIENDANCYALGEGSAGEAIGISDYVIFTMGTGIGCGIVTGGRLLTGSHGMAGEGGHLVVHGNVPCGCGGMGHNETLAAADGTSARAAARGLPADFGELWRLRGNADADEVIETTLDAMARTIASVCHLLDPRVVIIGGGMSRADGIVPAIHERTTPYLSRPFKTTFDLRRSLLGNDAALYGAAGI
jgi:glucokinase